mmetsp:Transcript_43421/g.81094  ORF Transcript_43421/g.81094 Transcript_43421/m.81094 type:complete len:304 (+) Transcript_43421:2-913(+)
MFMGFVKSITGIRGAPMAPSGQMPEMSNMMFAGGGEALGGNANFDSIDAFVAYWGLDSKCMQVLYGLDPAFQQRIMSGFKPTDMNRTNQMFMGFVRSVTGTSGGGAPTAHQAFSGGGGGAIMHSPEQFVVQWGLDTKCQQVLLTLDPQTQQRVMNGFQPKDMSRANQMFMGFVKSVSGGGGKGAPAANPGLNDLGSLIQAAAAAVTESGPYDGYGGGGDGGFMDQLGQTMAQPAGYNDGTIGSFVAQWGLDEKCQGVLLSLDEATQQRVMSGFQPKDMASASRMFMGFVKSVSAGGGSRFSPY